VAKSWHTVQAFLLPRAASFHRNSSAKYHWHILSHILTLQKPEAKKTTLMRPLYLLNKNDTVKNTYRIIHILFSLLRQE
jgi:hypothetical protein